MTEMLEYNDPHSPLNHPKRKLERFLIRLGRKKTLNLAVLTFAALMMPVALIAVQQQTSIKQRAASSTQVVFVDQNNTPVTQITIPTVKVKLTSPYTVAMAKDEIKAVAGVTDYNAVLAQASATFQIKNSIDDLNEVNGKLDPNSPSNARSVWIGAAGAANSYTGLRFTGVQIPKGAKINSARLAVQAAGESWIQMRFQIAGENSGNSTAFSSNSRPSQRQLTTNKVLHRSDVKWSANNWYTLDEMNKIIQEIVNRPDWQSGNSISIILKADGSGWGRKFVKSFDAGATTAPKLLVNYDTAGTIQPTATTTPTRIPTSTSTPVPPTATPTRIPTATSVPTATNIPSPVTTQSIVLAEDPNFLTNVQTITPVRENPTYFTYTFSNSTPGEKLLFAKFKASNGQEQVFSSSIMLTQIVQNPSPTHDMGSMGDNSHALGLWNPNPKYDTCPKAEDTARIKAIHDSYKVKGPDGKWYPTWHPPVDPTTGCKFGHEHGRDPKGSTMFVEVQKQYGYDADKNGVVDGQELTTAGVPFGYVNEQLDIYNSTKGITNGMRHEDHVGHKIEWENNIQRDWSTVNGGSGRVPSGVYCDFFMKIHQGTHSKDAFTNNMHELIQGYKCSDGIQMVTAQMLTFGRAGGFDDGGVAGGTTFVQVGIPTPQNAPNGSGQRQVPTLRKVLDKAIVPSGQWSLYSEGIYEDWLSGNYINTANGTQIAYYDPHFAVFSPSRFYWPPSDTNTYGITRSAEDIAANVGRSVDICKIKENNGAEMARGGECDWSGLGALPGQVAYDDPRSPFNGVKREFYFNNLNVSNTNGVTTWYSDPFGKNATTTPFTGSVKHFLKPKNDPKPYQYPFESNAIGGERNYGGNGVHAPN